MNKELILVTVKHVTVKPLLHLFLPISD